MINDIVNKYQLWIPLFLGYFTSSFCKIGSMNAGENIKARPPAFVFGIVWPILYSFLGYSWLLMKDLKNINLLFLTNCLLGSLWIYYFACKKNKKNALYVILFMILCGQIIYTYALQNNITLASYLILPYNIWLMFALLLNYKEVNDS